ncbi:hypothetical protein [Aliikangiella sp. G2MR2-5]|uniref:hypothetical protein n=1 Tax=Aliikangiella sp. G2MR2-5 TaxID=2788943 RepID=UPI0018ABD352|nr:hypothetical protein [Aliikangiella sp. G2MR2-5]
MNKPTLYLHIGMNKTGSSALQYWFNQNREALLDRGILYPKTGISGVAHYGISDILGFTGKNREDGLEINDIDYLKSSLCKEINSSSANKLLISSENFVLNRSLVDVESAFSDFECKILVYLRRHDSWLESAYNQSLKMVHQPKYGKGIEKFIVNTNKKTKNANYRYLVDRWARVFGKENIIIRPYESKIMSSGIVPDVLDILGLRAEEFFASNLNKVNASLSNRANAILEVAQRSGLSKEQVSIVLDYLKKTDEVRQKVSLLSPKRRRQIVKNNQSQYSYLSKKFLNGKQLFSEPVPMDDESWTTFKRPSEEEIVSEILKALNVSKHQY